MKLLTTMSTKQRKAAARRFLTEAAASFNGRPPIPDEDAVALKHYGTVWKGTSAIRVVLFGHRADPLWYQLRLEQSGPNPEDIVTDPERGRQLRETLASVFYDFDDFRKLIERPDPTPATGGLAPLTERETEVLRIFGVELGPRGFLISARRQAEAKG